MSAGKEHTVGSQTSPQRSLRVPDGRSPLWRAHNIFRVVTLVYATGWCAAQQPDYARPALAWVVIAAMAVWTVLTIWRYRTRPGRTNHLVLADQFVVTSLYFTSEIIMTPQQLDSDLPSVLTLWHASMITSAAVQWGMVGGSIAGCVASLSNFVLRSHRTPE
jgi:hypothetical protein